MEEAQESSDPNLSSSLSSSSQRQPSSSPQRNNDNDDERNNNTQQQSSSSSSSTTSTTIFVREWELTWPIWHMLSREERRALAHQHGYKTIGEFEEFMTLQRAVGDSTDGTMNISSNSNSNSNSNNREQSQQPYDNNLAYGHHYQDADDAAGASTRTITVKPVSTSTALGSTTKKDKVNDDDDYYNDDQDEELATTPIMERKTSNSTSNSDTTTTTTELPLSTEELIQHGGLILMLPEELLHGIFRYLPVDAYGTLALVSPHWKHVTRTEAVYRRLCERLYLQQSQRKTLQVSRFHHSYRTMLEQRARVRAGGGVYVLKYCEVKPIQRDMWTEIPWGVVLESIYYRYLYFQEDGRVLYALTSAPPFDVFRRFYKMNLNHHPTQKQDHHQHHNHHHQQYHHHQHEADNAAVWGSYVVKKNMVIVTAKQAWHTVQMHLRIPMLRTTKSPHGPFGTLVLERHLSSVSGCFDNNSSHDLVEYKVPPEVFRFVKDSKL